MTGDNPNTKQELWTGHIRAFLESGLSQKEWCQQNQIPVSTFSYWKRKLNSPEPMQDAVSDEPVFVKLPSKEEISDIPDNAAVPIIIFVENIRIQVSSSCPENLLSYLLGALKNHA